MDDCLAPETVSSLGALTLKQTVAVRPNPDMRLKAPLRPGPPHFVTRLAHYI
jgi:hypothetical protein